MLIKLGICILVWLTVGFIVGIKFIFVDKNLSEENLKISREKMIVDERTELAFKIVTKKSVFITISALLGFVAFYLDTKRTFQKKKD